MKGRASGARPSQDGAPPTTKVRDLNTALASRYRVERELGAGGMAAVYLAHDLKHDRPVALKVLRPELGAVLGGERFLAEIKTTAKLRTHTSCRCLIPARPRGCSTM